MKLQQLVEATISLKMDPVKRSIISMPFHTPEQVDAVHHAIDKYLTDISVDVHDRADILEWFETYVLGYDSTRTGNDLEYVQNFQFDRFED